MRCVETQDCPDNPNAAPASMAAAFSHRASACTMTGAFPPSSKTVRLRPASRRICPATFPLPVKLTSATDGWVMSARPTSGPPCTIVNTPGGNPASTAISPSRERRPELVGNKVERRVERRDAGDNAYRLIDCETQFSTPGRNWVHWNYHAVDAFGFLRGHLHG